MVPSKLVKTEKDLDEYRTKYDAMMQLKPLKENVSFILYLQDYTESWRLFRICQAISDFQITVLEDQEVPELKNKLKKINEDISKLREDVQTVRHGYILQNILYRSIFITIIICC